MNTLPEVAEEARLIAESDDGLIAAMDKVNSLTVVTQNAEDFERRGFRFLTFIGRAVIGLDVRQ